MSSRGSLIDKGKDKAIADSSEAPRRRRRTHSGVQISDDADTTPSQFQQQQPEEYVNLYGGADSGFYNDPSGGDFYHDPTGGGFYNNPTSQMEVDEEVARWIQFEELQRSQESCAFSGNPSINLDMEEAEAILIKNTTLKSALFTVHFRKVARKNEPGVFDLYCNYCPKPYKFGTGGGYGTYWSHITNNHQVELGRAQGQSQLNFQPVSSQNIKSQGEGNKCVILFVKNLYHFNLPIA
ncbi:hypothetical protein C2S51_000473 [Perilla frutescens var. frutescens]|nr:hypothetical protein C2S51_000473 [Perilla frutescens var. frutescens]